MSAIGAGQYIWLRLWNDGAEGDAAVIADGCLLPGEDVHFTFTKPQTVTRVALERVTKKDYEALIAEKGVKQEIIW